MKDFPLLFEYPCKNNHYGPGPLFIRIGMFYPPPEAVGEAVGGSDGELVFFLLLLLLLFFLFFFLFGALLGAAV